ncbi:hypothetical protein A0H81_03623 [Grifola frondosa]|uniref:Uncharacterized protein n=1 Tax=Grifola frondosa TaxID=5627 RepID=A0A1C7MH84_GRIFR|nr:hypothetical protein A0H81_03623 [Grifola frondosa]
MAKKKGPPYVDDPGCKYVVIDDPWPGHASGKDRGQDYFNRLGAWVWYMLGKKHEPEYLYSVNTRAEVIVELPEDTDITPILGAHTWRKFLSRGDQADIKRKSFVFEYNYKAHGRPENHNWLRHTPHDKPAALFALPLPASRVRTPTPEPVPQPDTSLFVPYQAPAHYHADISEVTTGAGPSATSQNEIAQPEALDDATEEADPPRLYVGKHDPYEEEDAALRILKQEPLESPLYTPAEHSAMTDRPIKREEPVQEHIPSDKFIAAVERYQQRQRAVQATTPSYSPDPRTRDPRLANRQSPAASLKRVHRDEEEAFVKRIKTEPDY